MRWALLGLTACVASACFYDSSFGAAKRAQTNNAVHATPAALATADEERHVPQRTYHLRAYVTDRFQAQEVAWDREIRDIVWGANEILAPAVGVRLDVDDMTTWKVDDETDLDALLTKLHEQDDGTRSDWIAGFVGAVPLMSESFHDVGRADVIGKHLVVRATTTEREAISESFNQLREAERDKLTHARKHHRGVAVFLHEMGHTLGAIHEKDRESLMYPEYGTKMSSYSSDAISIMRVTLEHRDSQEGLAAALVKLLDVPAPTPWVESDRAAALTRFRATLPQPAKPPEPIDEVPELTGDDRAAYRRAVQLSRDKDLKSAWDAAQPLFKRFPAVYAVQDLRCTLAMTLVGWPGSQVECAPLMKIARKH